MQFFLFFLTVFRDFSERNATQRNAAIDNEVDVFFLVFILLISFKNLTKKAN